MKSLIERFLKGALALFPAFALARIALEILLRYPGNHGPGITQYYPWFFVAVACTAVLWIWERKPPCASVLCVSAMTFVLFFAADKLNIALTYEEWILKGQPQWGQYRTRLTDFDYPGASVEECEKVLMPKQNDHFLLCLQENFLRLDSEVNAEIQDRQESDGIRYVVIDCISPLLHPGDIVTVMKTVDIADGYNSDSFSVISCQAADIHRCQDMGNGEDRNFREREFVVSKCEVSSFCRYWMSWENPIQEKSYSFQKMLLAFYRIKERRRIGSGK